MLFFHLMINGINYRVKIFHLGFYLFQEGYFLLNQWQTSKLALINNLLYLMIYLCHNKNKL